VAILGTLRRAAIQLLRVDQIRYVVAGIRFIWLVHVRKRLRTFESPSEGVYENAIPHNLGGMKDVDLARSNFLIRPLSVIESRGPELLVIGPRTEGEILNLMANGFDRRHITAVDLISYSPWIQLADMHDLPFPDDSFDAVLLGWVLAYSDDRERAARELIRTTRDGGTIAVGVEYNPLTDDEIVEEYGYLAAGGPRIESVGELLGFFRPYVDHVYFAHDVLPEARDRIGAVAAIFTISKTQAANGA